MTNSGTTKKLMEPPLRYLTKSLVRTALTCPRKLVYAANPKLYPRQDSLIEEPFTKYLADEGRRFGEYCKRCFPHGVEIDSAGVTGCSNTTDTVTWDESVQSLVKKTYKVLSQQHQRVTVFEGAVHHGHFYIRPDILDKIPNESNGKPELRVIEVKTKSYDSRPNSKQSSMWNGKKKKSIRASFLPYIQDVAFQSMVVKQAFPGYHVSSWLMLPDRGKVREESEDLLCNKHDVPTVQETMDTIDMSTATLLNVDELVSVALSSKVSFPGSNDDCFEDVIEKWAERFCYEKDLDTLYTEVPIGSQCATCQYRLLDPPKSTLNDINEFERISGFDVCWKHATGLHDKELKQPLVIDLYGYTKQSTAKFLGQEKFFLRDLSSEDFESIKDDKPAYKIHNLDRQWYQVASLQMNDRSWYELKRDNIQREIEKWSYPWHFIDFETSAPVLPYYSGMAPYEIFAFQFSHHIIHEDQKHETHHATEFLHTDRGVCPNEQFLVALHDAICTSGTVFQWSTFENTTLKSLLSSKTLRSSLSPDQRDSLSDLLSDGSRPMVDLCKLASDYYYVDGSDGSSSIKKLLAPTMNVSPRLKELYGAPTYNSNNFANFRWYRQDEEGRVIDPYKILGEIEPAQSAVTHGGGATTAYNMLQFNSMSEEDRRGLRKSLLRYCELDTLSMTMIVQAWQGFLEAE